MTTRTDVIAAVTQKTGGAKLTTMIVLVAMSVGMVACESTNAARLAMRQQALRQECFGNITNTCTSKNIDFDIAVLRSLDTEQWIPFSDVRTKDEMIEKFGDDGWKLFKESVEEERGTVITYLESKRPGWVDRWFRGEEPPSSDGVGAFVGPEDIQFIKGRIKNTFLQKLKNVGWQPKPVIDFSGGESGTTDEASSSTDHSSSTQTEDAEVEPNFQANFPSEASSSGAGPAQLTPYQQQLEITKRQRWAKAQKLLSEDPDAYVKDCVDSHPNFGKESNYHDPEYAAKLLLYSCQVDLRNMQGCIRQGTDAKQCYDRYHQNSD